MSYDEKENNYKKRYRKKLYRSQNGVVFGVCEGLAQYLGINVGIIRFIALLFLVFSGFAPIGIIYLLMAVFIPAKY